MKGLLSEEELIASGLLAPSKAGMTHYPSQYPNPVRFSDLYNMGANAVGRVMELGPEMRNAFPFPDYRNMPQQAMTSEMKDLVAGAAADMAMPYANLLPGKFLPGLLGIIAGKKAKTADLGLLAQAEELKAAGVPADEIYSNTKWWLDHPDGQPRFEIDDSKSYIDPRVTANIEDAKRYLGKDTVTDADISAMQKLRDNWTVPEFIKHQGLLDSYPNIKNTKVELDASMGSSGAYSDLYDTIGVSPDTNHRSTMLHELQHAIQGKEGYAQGGSPTQFGSIGTINPEESANSYRQYQRLAGEAEARLVQHRMNLTPEQRMQYPFFKPHEVYGYDVPLEDQIVRFDGGTKASTGLLDMPAKPWQMTKAQYDAPAKLKKTDTFYIPVGKDKVEVVLNPTPDDFRAMKKEARASGFVDTRDPPLRFTEDAEGNKYYWKSYQAVHPSIEGPLSKRVGTELNQNMGSKPSHRQAVRRALYDGEVVPSKVLAEYPGLLEEVQNIPGNKINNPAQMSLPMDESSRMQRAREMGFDTNKTLYHGTDQEIASFDNAKRGRVTGAGSAYEAHWFSDNPDTAGGYADLASSKAVDDLIKKSEAAERAGKWDEAHNFMVQAEKLEQSGGKGGENIIPLRLRGKIKEYDADGQMMYQLEEGQLNKWVKEAKAEGYEGVAIKNLSDEAGYGQYRPVTHYAIFDPKNIRSKFAKFDPKNKNSANILASGLGGALGLGLLSQDDSPAHTNDR